MGNDLVKKSLEYHGVLLEDDTARETLVEYGGISQKDIIDNNIGWNKEQQKYTIPISDGNGGLVEIIERDIDSIDDWIEELGKAYNKIPFEKSISSDHYGKAITFNGIIIGKDLSPYLIPRLVKIKCGEAGAQMKRCANCRIYQEYDCNPLSRERGFEYNFRCHQDRDIILSFINTSDAHVKGYIRRYFAIPDYSKCRKVTVDIATKQNVEEIMVSAELDYSKMDAEYMVQRSFVFSTDIKTNAQYQFYGTTWGDPRTQRSTHIINRTKASLDSVSKWRLTPEVKEKLKVFKPKDPRDVDSITEKIQGIQDDLAHNVTRIKKRNNIIMALDLVYHSVLQFNFLGHRVTKGWMECLIGGDTRTGKTETIRSLVKHYRAGEFLTSGENVSLAGILGGVQQTHGNSRWSLTWGKIPLNDRGALVIDESENLVKAEIMGFLSGVRSSGIAELHKIQSRRTLARTRLVFIANPIHGDVGNYNFGVDIIKEIMGQQQDVARLDFAVLASKEDVPISEINQRDTEEYEHFYTSELCHNRVMFAWSRRPEDIYIEKDAENAILHAATLLGEKFSSDIPLVVGAEMRIKLARMAISVAAMVYSTDDEGEKVIVNKAHVLFAINFLESQYHNRRMGYYDYSQQRLTARTLRGEEQLDEMIYEPEVINELLVTRRIQLTDIEDIFATDDRGRARQTLAKLRKCGALKKISYYYHKTPPFITWLKNRRHALTNLHAEPNSFNFENPFEGE